MNGLSIIKKTSLFSAALMMSAAVSALAVENIPVLEGPSFIDSFKTKPEDKQVSQEIFIEADQIDYDTDKSLVIASGKVEILKGETVLFADQISYNQSTNSVTANGNVVVSDATGETFFTDSFVLSDDLSEGVVNHFSAMLSDGTLVAAARATRKGTKIDLEKAVYSACPVPKDGNPLWQIKASEIEVDEDEQRIRYYNAFFDVYGTPVFYTPYFSHPTPDADRKSGFLAPEVSSDSNLGAVIKTSYYYNLSPDVDITFNPIYTSREGFVYAGGFRHLTPYGQYGLSGSFTRASRTDSEGNRIGGNESRNHIKGDGLFDITDNWQLGFDAEIASDETYLRRYDFNNTDLLTSRLFAERTEDRDYSVVQSLFFQGLLEEDDQDLIPFSPIYTRNHYETEKGVIPGFDQSYLWNDTNGFLVNRDIGEESGRISNSFGVTIPTITSGGHLLSFDASVRTDYFDIDENVVGGESSRTETRVIPEISAQWSLPLVNDLGGGSKVLFEPIVKVVVAPNIDYNEDIPNEDSQDVEFSSLNLFSNNRFRGIDRVESGTRVHYGIKGGVYEDGRRYTYTIGQSYSARAQSDFGVTEGLDDNLSDYVGSVTANFYNTLDFSYRFRFDKDNFKAKRSEIDATADLDPVELNLNYTFVDGDVLGSDDSREEVSGSLKLGITDEWSILAGGRRNLAEDSNVDAYGGVSYEGCCITINATVEREFLSDRDVDSGTSFNLQLGLKNLTDL